MTMERIAALEAQADRDVALLDSQFFRGTIDRAEYDRRREAVERKLARLYEELT